MIAIPVVGVELTDRIRTQPAPPRRGAPKNGGLASTLECSSDEGSSWCQRARIREKHRCHAGATTTSMNSL
jgi:hypothetical protein